MRRKRVVVAMSGGVDSSVAAALLVERGYEVIGMMLRLWGEPGEGTANRCCTLDATEDARRVARALGIPFYPLNCVRPFKEKVVDSFVHAYAHGCTPNPCLSCNRHIKFGFLLRMALGLDADYLATGHYARVQRVNGQHQLLRGLDQNKDQSYVLYMLGQEQLSRAMFPIGEHSKPQVRALAAKWNLPVADKADSQDLCFVRDGDYRRFLRTHAPDTVCPGSVLDTAGRELGQHQGLPFYTVGQRRGLGIAHPEPLYVIEIDVAQNALIVGPAAQLGRQDLEVRDVSFVSGRPPALPAPIAAQIRYSGHEMEAVLRAGEGEHLRVHLHSPARDITPGQAAVFYRGQVLLGGGVIARQGLDNESTRT